MAPDLSGSESISRFTGRTITRPFLLGLIVPGAFLLMTAENVQLPSSIAEAIVYPLSSVWPVLHENYALMKKAGYEANATNYVYFFAIILLFNTAVFFYLCMEYIRNRRTIRQFDLQFDGGGLLAFLFLGPALYLVFSRWDHVVFEFRSLSDFYMDPYGLFYIHEYIVLTTVWFPIFFFFICIARTLDRIRINCPSSGVDR